LKASELRDQLDKIINEIGDRDVSIFTGDGEWLRTKIQVSKAGTDRPVSEQEIWLEV